MFDQLSSGWISFLESYSGVLQVIAIVTAALIAISSADDLFVDLCFWVRSLYRRLFVQPRHKPLSEEELLARAEQPIAIMIPAWREHEVIEAMVENTVRSLNYENYNIFIGTYANDPETKAEVARLAQRYKRVVSVEVDRHGPTSKADCLNWIVRAIFRHERGTGREYAGMVMHDCEDVLHPLELKFYNYLLPRKDLIQLPVVSLERKHWELLAGTYMDEFAEWHAKDLVAREAIARSVPSAGVGTCLSRRAMAQLAAHNHDEPFNTGSLTEDYDIAARLAKEGLSSIIARFPVTYRVRRGGFFGLGAGRLVTLRMPLCVREYFPNTFRTAYRQKARWTLGISIQGWSQLGWTPSIATNYFLLRDRKALITPAVAMVGYFLLINWLLFRAGGIAGQAGIQPLFPDKPWVHVLLVFNLVALILRMIQRFYFVARIYGVAHGVMSIPRTVVGTFVNFAASARAIRIYVQHLLFGSPITWDKTMHEFPNAAALAHERRHLGEILTSWQAVSDTEVNDALNEQRAHHQPLGRILVAKGWLDDETLAEAIAVQTTLPRGVVTKEALRKFGDLLPAAVSIRHRVLCIGMDQNGGPILAVAGPISEHDLADLSKALGGAPSVRVVRESEIAAGLRLMRGDDQSLDRDQAFPLLGDMLIDRGHVRKEAFDAAMRTYQPDSDGRVGDYLLRLGVVTGEALASTIEAQRLAMTSTRSSAA